MGEATETVNCGEVPRGLKLRNRKYYILDWKHRSTEIV